MQKITRWSEQLKSKDFQFIRTQLSKHKQHVFYNSNFFFSLLIFLFFFRKLVKNQEEKKQLLN